MRYLSDNQFEELLDRVVEIKEEAEYSDNSEELVSLLQGLEKAIENMDKANTWNGTRLVQQ